MRSAFTRALGEHAVRREEVVFLTGDLGFGFLEPLRDLLGERFINCGVAEQNMIGVAAGLAREGLEVWAYSIGPFLYARPLEQIRNDLCLHGLPARLVANGGGYGYGVMGPSHHALEDYGLLSALPGMHALIPAFNRDLAEVVGRASALEEPSYVRLGLEETPPGYEPPPWQPWRRLTEGDGPVAAVCGPLAGTVLGLALGDLKNMGIEVWTMGALPLTRYPPPEAFARRIEQAPGLLVVEEHRAHGGAGAGLALWGAEHGWRMPRFRLLSAQGYPSGRYGSQPFHRRECGLDPDSIRRTLMNMESQP